MDPLTVDHLTGRENFAQVGPGSRQHLCVRQLRQEAPYYMPIHYVEPVEGNVVVIDLDKLHSKYSTSKHFDDMVCPLLGLLMIVLVLNISFYHFSILAGDACLHFVSIFRSLIAVSANNVVLAVNRNKPILSPRLRLVQDTSDAYGVILAHPGVPTSIENVTRSNTVAQIVARVPSFLRYALRSSTENQSVYLYDSTESSSSTTDQQPAFLGALAFDKHQSSSTFTELPECDLKSIPRPTSSRYYEQEMGVAGRKWTIVIVSTAYPVDLKFVVVGGTLILAASILCAASFYSHLARIAKLNEIKSKGERERAEIARIQVARERHLNEFMAHEVRNPLSSAISALSFVSAGVSEHVPDPVNKKAILEDVGIMDASLQFINELLHAVFHNVKFCVSHLNDW